MRAEESESHFQLWLGASPQHRGGSRTGSPITSTSALIREENCVSRRASLNLGAAFLAVLRGVLKSWIYDRGVFRVRDSNLIPQVSDLITTS